MRESRYERDLKGKLRDMFPGCYIFKGDSAQYQGIPDILILYGPRWAMLEVKKDEKAGMEPNQEFYVHVFGEMSFASFINPAIEAQVLDELQRTLRPCG